MVDKRLVYLWQWNCFVRFLNTKCSEKRDFRIVFLGATKEQLREALLILISQLGMDIGIRYTIILTPKYLKQINHWVIMNRCHLITLLSTLLTIQSDSKLKAKFKWSLTTVDVTFGACRNKMKSNGNIIINSYSHEAIHFASNQMFSHLFRFLLILSVVHVN